MNILVCTSVLLILYSFTSVSSAAGCYNVNCKVDPCTFFDPLQCSNHPDVKCRPNYCGGCIAELWENGEKVTDCVDLTTLG